MQLESPSQSTDDEIMSLGLEPAPLREWLRGIRPYEDHWEHVALYYFSEWNNGVRGANVFDDFRAFGFTQAAATEAAARINEIWYKKMEPRRWAEREVMNALNRARLKAAMSQEEER